MDYHAQLQIVAKGLKAAQDKLEGMEIRPPWLRGSFRLYKFVVPVAFFMGDTPAHNKLCCIKNHQKADFICRLCNVPRTKLDDPKFKYRLRDSRLLKKYLQCRDFNAIDKLGYYPCYNNVLLELQFLDQQGMNLALPPESMHVVCLGYMPHIVQGFSRVRKLKVGSATENDNDRGTHYVFGEEYLNHAQVEAKLIKLGKILQNQPDPDKPRTAFTTFLIDSDPKQTCKTEKNKLTRCEVFC